MTTLYTITCEHCGKDFLTKRKIARFCSFVCSNFSRRTAMPDPIAECKSCKSLFKRDAPNRLFCSKKCFWHSAGNRPPSKGYVEKSNGYRYVSYKGKSILEHRLIMEMHIGRSLDGSEQVHHIDGDKLNNDISNLRLYSCISEHQREAHSQAKDLTHRYCIDCGEYKPRTDFYKKGPSKIKPGCEPNIARCKPCYKIRLHTPVISRPYKKTSK